MQQNLLVERVKYGLGLAPINLLPLPNQGRFAQAPLQNSELCKAVPNQDEINQHQVHLAIKINHEPTSKAQIQEKTRRRKHSLV